jgi:putative sterol carrier protein
VATVEQCEAALHELAARMREHGGSGDHARFERTLSCTLRDLRVTFVGLLREGQLTDIERADGTPSAQIRLDMTSDDLIAMVDGTLNLAAAWAAGRVKVHAGVRDMLRLRSMF